MYSKKFHKNTVLFTMHFGKYKIDKNNLTDILKCSLILTGTLNADKFLKKK